MCHWVSDKPQQVLTAVATKKNQHRCCQPTLGDFSAVSKSVRPAVWKCASFIQRDEAPLSSSNTKRPHHTGLTCYMCFLEMA